MKTCSLIMTVLLALLSLQVSANAQQPQASPLTFNFAAAELNQDGAELEQSPASSIWKIAKTPNPNGNNDLFAISAESATDIWAVGLISAHFDGKKWTAFPVVQADEWDSVAAVSSKDAWAVGQISQNGLHFSRIQHWDGKQWSLVDSPHFSLGDILMGVQAISARDIYAVGWSADIQKGINPLVEHWDGNTWSVVNTPRFKKSAILYSIAIVSASDMWAVGKTGTLANFNDQPFAMHFDGKEWKKASMPVAGKGESQFWHVAAISTNDVWAVGLQHANPNHAPALTLVEHWDGTEWKIVPSPNVNPQRDNGLFGVGAISSKDVWACGSWVDNHGNPTTLAEHWDGGKWTVSKTPQLGSGDTLFGVAALPPGNVWLAGQAFVGAISKSVVLQTTQGR